MEGEGGEGGVGEDGGPATDVFGAHVGLLGGRVGVADGAEHTTVEGWVVGGGVEGYC